MACINPTAKSSNQIQASEIQSTKYKQHALVNNTATYNSAAREFKSQWTRIQEIIINSIFIVDLCISHV